MKKFQTSTIICMPTDVRNQKEKAQPFTGISSLTAAPAQKAGNISQIASRVRGREAQIMSYSYDYLSRLSTSTFHNYSDAGVISGTNNYNENLTYDLRGNIQTLQRTGFYRLYGSLST